MFSTFGEVKESTVANIAGECADSILFRDHVNEATRKLMRRGDFQGTVVPVHLCVRNGCVVMPRYIQSVRKVNHCRQPVPVRNLWYDFLSDRNQTCHWLGQELGWNAAGQVPVYQDVLGDGRLIRAYASVPEDYNIKVRIFGIDNGNQPLRTDNEDGTWSDGIDIEILNPFGSTNTYVRRIDRVLKPITQGIVRLYAYDATNNVLEDIARYDPSETNPSYQKMKVRMGCTGNCGDLRSVIALVKLRFIPVRDDNDLVLISNLDMLKAMVQSVKAQEQGDIASARQFELDAIREGNLEIADYNPDDQIPATLGAFGGVPIRQQSF